MGFICLEGEISLLLGRILKIMIMKLTDETLVIKVGDPLVDLKGLGRFEIFLQFLVCNFELTHRP